MLLIPAVFLLDSFAVYINILSHNHLKILTPANNKRTTILMNLISTTRHLEKSLFSTERIYSASQRYLHSQCTISHSGIYSASHWYSALSAFSFLIQFLQHFSMVPALTATTSHSSIFCICPVPAPTGKDHLIRDFLYSSTASMSSVYNQPLLASTMHCSYC